jgi:tellurite resistance protein
MSGTVERPVAPLLIHVKGGGAQAVMLAWQFRPKENDMLASKWVVRLAAVVAVGALSACASPAGPSAERHQHLKDAKQGPALSYAPTQAAAPVLFHDHREMK